MPAKTIIQARRGTAAFWTSQNPVLALGEFGFESDTGKLKIGDGVTAWTSLGYGPTVAMAVGGDLSGSLPSPNVIAASGAFALRGILTPPQITADQNDYNPTDLATAAVLRLQTDAARNITGLAGGVGVDGRLMVVRNVGAFNITLKNQSTASLIADRFSFAGGVDVILAPNDSIVLLYSSTLSRWIGLTHEFTAGTGLSESGTVISHAADASALPDAHHVRLHNHSAAGDGTSLSPATLVLPGAASPGETAEGSVVWDTDDDKLTVGTGSARKTLVNDDDARLTDSRAPSGAAGGELAGTYPNPTVAASHSGSAHHNPLTIGADGEHSLATQVLSGVDASASQKGHASFSSKFGVTAGAVDLAAGGHGATEHADITRSFWLPTAIGTADGATATTTGTVPDAIRLHSLADAAVQGTLWNWPVPRDCKAASVLNVLIYWAPAAADASVHVVRWSCDALALTSGVVLDAAGTGTPSFDGVSQANATAKALVIEAATQLLASVNAGDVIRISIRRNGTHANDTFNQAVLLVGIELQYTAVQ